MKRLVCLLVLCIVAVLPAQVLAGYAVSHCPMDSMGGAADDCPCCDHHGDDQGTPNHHACSKCMACWFSGGAVAPTALSSAIAPVPHSYQGAEILPFDSFCLEPPTRPPRFSLA